MYRTPRQQRLEYRLRPICTFVSFRNNTNYEAFFLFYKYNLRDTHVEFRQSEEHESRDIFPNRVRAQNDTRVVRTRV